MGEGPGLALIELDGKWLSGRGEYVMDDGEERADSCDGAGIIPAECFEDICCCAAPELAHDVMPCPVCP